MDHFPPRPKTPLGKLVMLQRKTISSPKLVMLQRKTISSPPSLFRRVPMASMRLLGSAAGVRYSNPYEVRDQGKNLCAQLVLFSNFGMLKMQLFLHNNKFLMYVVPARGFYNIWKYNSRRLKTPLARMIPYSTPSK